MAVYLGIDLGTSGLKSLLIRPDGRICGSGYCEYPISIPHIGFAEQNPEHWWNALKQTVREAMADAGVTADEIAGIGLSGQMHGTVLLDGDGRVLAPAIIWCDQRSKPQVSEIYSRIGRENIGKWTQNPVSTGFQVSSLMWIRENQPQIYQRARHVLLPKDYIRFRLTGLIGTEPTDACSTLLFNCIEENWSREMLDALQMAPQLFPEVSPAPTQIHGGLCGIAARELGLIAGTPVVFGGGDQPMQAVGNGIIAPGDASITLGTGGQIFVPIAQPIYDPQLRLQMFCHAQPQTWYVMGATLNCCLAQNWFFDKVLEERDFDRMHQKAANVAPGSNGLYFLPYLTGERTPHMNAQARGMFFGLTLSHDQAVMTRAVIEGISYALLDAMYCIRQMNPPPQIDRLILSGGGARSALWRQIIADMMGCPIYAATMREEAGVGAAICAMVGVGEYSDLHEACGAIVHDQDDFTMPISENTQFYQERFATFQKLYRANASLFSEC